MSEEGSGPVQRATPMAAGRFPLRLSVATSLLTLILALVWAGYGFKQESARTPAAEAVTFPDLYEASIAELQAGLDEGQFTSVDLVKVRCCFSGVSSSCTTLMISHTAGLLCAD